jgi:uncharacterized protein YdaU (DUF1376 family)
MHYYKFNIKDWSRDTAHLSVEEEGVYRRLLDHYYESESPIPSETKSVIRRLRLGGHEEAFGVVLGEFFTLEADGYRHRRCDDEIAKYHAKATANRENGKRGGRPEKAKENPDGYQEKPIHNLNQEPLTTNQETKDQDQKICAATAAPALVENLTAITVPDQPKTSRGTRLATDWTLPEAWREWAITNRPDLSVELEADKFRDHWHAATGTRATKADWLATWRNWVRNANASRNVHAFPAKSRYTNLPQVNAEEIRAKTEENKRLGVRRANF